MHACNKRESIHFANATPNTRKKQKKDNGGSNSVIDCSLVRGQVYQRRSVSPIYIYIYIYIRISENKQSIPPVSKK